MGLWGGCLETTAAAAFSSMTVGSPWPSLQACRPCELWL